ncbi:PaaI family thioesterase [Gordonia sp. DT30]|uniref:PaaI family thioesterase n=1 Tax=unclassified Gordonia (in: high G+C Gram-positive bacteria) TaxID=2657482 RepID=UPI003CF05BA9
MSGYFLEDLGPDELRERTQVAQTLAAEVRALISATVLTEVEADAAAEAVRHIEAATEILRAVRLDEDSFGARFTRDGAKRTWGNAVIGTRNPVAPPVVLNHDGELTWSEFELGPAYEGPAGLVHGGILAAILDQILGSAADHSGHPGMTGTLTIRYRQGTKLGKVRAEAWLDRVEGVKSIAAGRIMTEEGITAEAEGIFILPRWARETDAAEKLRKSLGDG